MSIFKKNPTSPSQVPPPSTDTDISSYARNLLSDGRAQCENVFSIGRRRLQRIRAIRGRLRGIA